MLWWRFRTASVFERFGIKVIHSKSLIFLTSVERIVNDIDAIVRIVRVPGWQKTISGEREVQKSLIQAL